VAKPLQSLARFAVAASGHAWFQAWRFAPEDTRTPPPSYWLNNLFLCNNYILPSFSQKKFAARTTFAYIKYAILSVLVPKLQF
jgi:hypothetical protein